MAALHFTYFASSSLYTLQVYRCFCVQVCEGQYRMPAPHVIYLAPISLYTLQVYRCLCVQVCEGRYRTAALLRAHRRRHTSDASRHVCEICGRTFMYRSNLEVHSAVHTSERAFPCSTCGKSFKTASTLSAHQVSHHNHHHHRHF